MTCEACGGEAKEVAREYIKEPENLERRIEIEFECESCHGIFYIWEVMNESA